MAKTPALPTEKDSAGTAAADAGARNVKGIGASPALAASLAQLSPDEASVVLELLEKALKRRKIQLWGYILAGVVLIVGMLGALYYYGLQDDGVFVGWAFVVPVLLVGAVLYGFGAWSQRYRTPLEERFEAEQRQKARAAGSRRT